MKIESNIQQQFSEHLHTLENTAKLSKHIAKIARICINAVQNGNKILLFGNGGSAADAQHIAAELVGRYKKQRPALAAIALTTDTSALTSIGNDFGYDYIFTRQIEALGHNGDILIGLSTSGNSQNVVNGLTLAKEMGLISIGLSGNAGGKMNDCTDINLVIPTNNTPRIQEMHILIGHILCEMIENAIINNPK